MITYKIYSYPSFEELHKDYFNSLLEIVRVNKLFSSKIDKIIITDEIEDEITRQCDNIIPKPKLTRDREFKGVSKTIDIEGKKRIFFDALSVNSYYKYTPKIFIEQLIEVYAEDIISHNVTVLPYFSISTPIDEIVKMLFSQWASKIISNIPLKSKLHSDESIHRDVKIYVDAFKRNIKRLHYIYQENLSIEEFWINSVKELDFFIRRCIDVRSDNGSFENLQEFSNTIPEIINDIEIQSNNIINGDKIDFSNQTKLTIEIFKLCYINIPNGDNTNEIIIDSPKKLFRNNIIDTEKRIVAFIDILGFSNIIEEYDNNIQSNILNELHDTLESAVKIAIQNITDQNIETEIREYIEYRMFSDCICISIPYIEYGNDFLVQFNSIAMIARIYQFAMMQKGFFVRGGISIGSYYSDKNMIFSGGLVSAYKLEQKAKYPIIIIDKTIIGKLINDYAENSVGVFFDKIFIFDPNEPDKVFLNPFEILDNSNKYFNYIQSIINNILDKNNSEYSSLTNEAIEIIKLNKEITDPIFDYCKNNITSETSSVAKELILDYINKHLEIYQKKRLSLIENAEETKETDKIIEKFNYIKKITNWSLNKSESSDFKYFQIKERANS